MQKIFSLIIILLVLNIIKIASKITPLKEEKIEIKINSISIPQAACVPSLGTYIFNINCEFSKSPIITQSINLCLSSNIKSICYPLESTSISNSFLQCEINTVAYPINNENIFMPSKIKYILLKRSIRFNFFRYFSRFSLLIHIIIIIV